MSRPPQVVVVGGGVGGLATAAILARGGADVTLLERHGTLGGRTGRLDLDGFRFDTGPSWYFMPEVLAHTFALLGARADELLDLVPLDPVYRLFPEPVAPGTAATPLDLPADPDAQAALFESREPGAGEAMRRYAEQAGEAYRLALDHVLYTTFARPDRVPNLALAAGAPRLGGLLTSSLASHIDATVTDPVLRQMLGYHAVFLGSSPYRVPALYSLMSHLDLGQGVLHPRGGMYTLVEALAELARREGVRVRTGVDVVGIEVDAAPTDPRHPWRRGRATGVRLADGQVLAADVVVSNADRHHTETALLPDRYADLPESSWERRTPGISALLIMAGVRGRLPELAHHSLFFTRDWPANFDAILGRGAHPRPDDLYVPVPASLYVARPGATDESVAPAGDEALFVLVPYPADESLGAGDEGRALVERQADGYLDQIGAWAGIDRLRERVVVRRVVAPADFATDLSSWRGGALGMEHTLRQSAMFRPGVASRRVPNLLHVGGGTMPGVGLPMVAIGAELVVKRMLGETSARPLPTPLRPGFLAAARPAGVWSRIT
jgi:phytoene desaturase